MEPCPAVAVLHAVTVPLGEMVLELKAPQMLIFGREAVLFAGLGSQSRVLCRQLQDKSCIGMAAAGSDCTTCDW